MACFLCNFYDDDAGPDEGNCVLNPEHRRVSYKHFCGHFTIRMERQKDGCYHNPIIYLIEKMERLTSDLKTAVEIRENAVASELKALDKISSLSVKLKERERVVKRLEKVLGQPDIEESDSKTDGKE